MSAETSSAKTVNACREPGCPFPVSDRVASLVGYNRCEWCNGEPKCATKKCPNKAQRGTLCRLCAGVMHPGQVFHLGRWKTQREFASRIMRDPIYRGVKWTADRESMCLIGRDGSFEIRLRMTLWSTTPRVE